MASEFVSFFLFFCFGRGMCRYVRVLGAFYLRLTGSDVDVYRYLEPLYNDYRKLRRKLADGSKISQCFCIEFVVRCFSIAFMGNSLVKLICCSWCRRVCIDTCG